MQINSVYLLWAKYYTSELTFVKTAVNEKTVTFLDHSLDS